MEALGLQGSRSYNYCAASNQEELIRRGGENKASSVLLLLFCSGPDVVPSDPVKSDF